MSEKWRHALIWIIKANAVTWTVTLCLFGVLLLLGFDASGLVVSRYFSKVLFLESGILLLVGGLVAFGSGIFSSKVREHVFKSGEEWSMEKLRKGEKRANLFILAGALLFAQSLLVSLLAL
ncbi:MAG: hypothetical protein ACE14S_07435 [Candidatus Bathyarchaeia archaeon]